MAREKTIKRTIIVGYNYEVAEKQGNTLEIIGTLQAPSTIRSIKEGKKLLGENGFSEDCVLVPTGTEQKVFEMSEALFMEYASEVYDA